MTQPPQPQPSEVTPKPDPDPKPNSNPNLKCPHFPNMSLVCFKFANVMIYVKGHYFTTNSVFFFFFNYVTFACLALL